jgi:exosome complex exonuclease RRP6
MWFFFKGAKNNEPLAAYVGGTNDFEYFNTHHSLNAEFRGLDADISGVIRDLCAFARPGQAQPLLSGDLLDPLAFDAIVDIIDDLLESADVNLDMISEGDNKSDNGKTVRDVVDRERLMHSQCLNLTKPQLAFKDAPDNDRDTPFVSKVSLKVNASVPLERSLAGPGHAYDAEISALRYDGRSIVDYVPVGAPMPPPAYNEQPFHFIDTVSGLVSLVEELKGVEELAVDLENHSLRSFQGFSCVMQVCIYFLPHCPIRSLVLFLPISFPPGPKITSSTPCFCAQRCTDC